MAEAKTFTHNTDSEDLPNMTDVLDMDWHGPNFARLRSALGLMTIAEQLNECGEDQYEDTRGVSRRLKVEAARLWASCGSDMTQVRLRVAEDEGEPVKWLAGHPTPTPSISDGNKTVQLELIDVDGFDDDAGGTVGYLMADTPEQPIKVARGASNEDLGELLAMIVLHREGGGDGD